MSKVYELGTYAYLSGGKAAVIFNDDIGFTDDTRDQKISVTPKNKPSKEINFIPRGQDNALPLHVLEKIYKNITTASNIDFNTRINIGDGLMVVRKVRDKTGKVKFEEVLDSEEPEIFDFIYTNNIDRILHDGAADMATFADGYVELILNRESSPKIVQVRYKEATFSRLSVMNETTGDIEYHGYSAKWGIDTLDDVIITPFLDREAPIYDIKKRLGILPDPNTGKYKKVSDRRFIMSLSLPTPGRFYYNKPYWWSIFESGWYDFACAIPAFKKALIKNEMVLKYHVQINENFWDKLYKSEGITDDKDKVTRRTQFLMEMDQFLSGEENAGKSFVSHFKYDQIKNYEIHDIIIKPIESFLKGGEYIEDSEEASNSICYAMGVHPSLQGASPGKGKTINGTEARELFIIKNAISKPIRIALVSFLYLIKAINLWNPDIHFVISNIELTTLDKNTGSDKSIGNQPI